MSLTYTKPNLLIIVDDSTFDLKINSSIATHARVFEKILCFSAAAKALDFLAENIHNPDVFPQIILLDIQMPEMDGFEFIKQFDRFSDEFKKKSKVIMLSSTDDLGDITRAESDKNILTLLKKPLQLQQFKAVLSTVYNL